MNEEGLSYLQKLEVTPGWRKEIVDLIREDLTFGLTKEQVQLYAQKDGSIERMRLYSNCLRKGYSEEVIAQLLTETLDIYRCKVAVDFYEQGVSVEKIVEVIQSTANAKEMQSVFQEFMNKKEKLENETCDMPPYAQELINQIKSVVGQIKNNEEYYSELRTLVSGLAGAKQYEETIERLHRDIIDRDVQINAQQDDVNAGHKKVAEQRNQIERLEEELKKMSETVNSLEAKLQEKEEQEKALTNKTGNKNVNNLQSANVAENGGYTPPINGIPVYYSVPVVDRGKVVGRVHVENTKKRGDGSMGLLAKIAGIFMPDRDMVKKVIEADLSPAQLVQVRTGMEKGLTESQLYKLIDNDLSPETMQEIIDLAVLINKNK